MKSVNNLPKDRQFFDTYARLASSVRASGYFAQFVSAATEIGIIYALAYNALAEFFPSLAVVLAIITAIIGTAVIEVGLRLTTPHAVDAVLYHRWSGLYLAMSIAVLILTTVLMATSGYLSFSNSGEIVENLTPHAKQLTTTQTDSIYQAETAMAKAQFVSDTALIQANYKSMIVATIAAYDGKINAAQSEFDKWESKEKVSGRNYTTYKANAQINKAEIIAERDGIISDHKSRQAKEIAAAKLALDGLLKESRRLHKSTLAEIKAANQAAKAERAEKIDGYGGGLGWFTVVCLFIFAASVVLDRIHKKGSGIEEKVQLTQYDVSPSALTEFFAAISERISYNLKAWIFDFASSTPPPPLPISKAELYDESTLIDSTVELKIEGQDEQKENTIQIAARRRVGFVNYQKEDETSSALYSTPSTKGENTESSKDPLQIADLKQRLKMYKKRLGQHTQKARQQQQKHGKVKKRTADAIANNEKWVQHFETRINQAIAAYKNQKS